MKEEKQTLKVKLINFTKKHLWIRKMVRRILGIGGFLGFKLRTLGIKTDDKTAIFFAFKGKSYACSPKAIYDYMLTDEKYEDFNYIWAFNEPEKHKEIANKPNTRVIKYGGKEYQKCLAKAKYWIFNYRVDDCIYPKKNQVYLQCWHGTPLKKLGYDLKDTHNAMNSESEIHNKYKLDRQKFDYLLSPSKFASEKFATGWNMVNTNTRNKLLEVGYPRNDFLYNYTENDVKVIKEKLDLPKEKKIILYAPTWRDDQHQAGIGYTYKTEVDFDMLQNNLQNDYIILYRAHYLVANSFDFAKYKGFIYDVSQVDDINELYIITDVLITDYSSVFFDYANLKRPMIFYMDIDELPGDILKTEEGLVEAIRKTDQFAYDEKYKRFNEKYNYLDDGEAAKRVVQKIIK